MQFAEARILIFTKPPIAGQTKTRLIPALGEQGATELHTKLTRHILKIATGADLCPVELWCASDIDHPFFCHCMNDFQITLKQQHGDDLGQRMAGAFHQTLKTSTFSVIIGTDCPGLTKKDLNEALHALKNGTDCVLGPAEDGGYVLIGLRRFNETIFQDIHWGGGTVLADTRDALNRLGWQWRELETHWDVDRPEDLKRLDDVLT